MKLNPFNKYVEHEVHEATKKVWEEHHWGNQLTFPARGVDDQKLVFQLRLPDGMELIDVVKLAQAARGAPAYVGAAMTALEQAKQVPGVIVVGALRGDGVPEEQREVVAALTVTLTQLDGPFELERFLPKDSSSTVKSEQDHAEISDNTTRVHRISGESQGEGKDPLPMLLIEYLWRSTYGLVTIAFSTSRIDMMTAQAAELFDQIRQTAFIGYRETIID